MKDAQDSSVNLGLPILTPESLAGGCRKCGGAMKRGLATGQTAVARRESRGNDDCRTFYAGGTGKLIACMKCGACGWSVTLPAHERLSGPLGDEPK